MMRIVPLFRPRDLRPISDLLAHDTLAVVDARVVAASAMGRATGRPIQSERMALTQ